MKVYVSGPMTSYQDFNRSAFRKAEARLRDMGHDPVIPVDSGVPANEPWAAHLRADIRMLMDCHAIAMLPGWEGSKGARLEVGIARALGFVEVGLYPVPTVTDQPAPVPAVYLRQAIAERIG